MFLTEFIFKWPVKRFPEFSILTFCKYSMNLIISRSSCRGCYTKKVFSKISQNSQGNTFVGVSYSIWLFIYKRNGVVVKVRQKWLQTRKHFVKYLENWWKILLQSNVWLFSQNIHRIFSKCQCRFRKGHIPQHCLLYMLEKIKQAGDNNSNFVQTCLKHLIVLTMNFSLLN